MFFVCFSCERRECIRNYLRRRRGLIRKKMCAASFRIRIVSLRFCSACDGVVQEHIFSCQGTVKELLLIGVKNNPFTCSDWERSNYRVFLKNSLKNFFELGK